MPIRLNWDNRVNADEIRVYRSTSTMDPNSLPAALATLGAGVQTYLDEAVAADTTYFYRIAAVLTSASPEQIAVSPELEITNYSAGASPSPSPSPPPSSPSPGTFPYDLPFLSVDATGTASDWTEGPGSSSGDMGILGDSPSSNRWILSVSGPDRIQRYQEFDVGASRHSTIDAGQCVLDMSHNILTFTDADGGMCFAEFYDGSSPPGYLGKAFSRAPYTPDTETITGRTDIMVPPGTRTIRAGWQGTRSSGAELSVYVKDIAMTLREANAHVTDVVLVHAEKGADSTGFITVTNTPETRSFDSASSWQWDVEGYYMGASFSTTAGKRELAVPSGWLTKIATGNVRVRVMSQLFTANLGDDCGVGITFIDDASPAGTSYEGTGRVDMTRTPGEALSDEITLAWIDRPVPADTTDLELLMQWWRVGGTVSDGAVNNTSVLFYEETGVETYFDFSPLNTSRNVYANKTGRIVPTSGALPSPLPGASTKIRITIEGHASQHSRLDKMFVGIKSGTYGFASTPVEVTFAGGGSGIENDIPPGVMITSDVVDFAFDPAVDEMVISFYVGNDTARDDMRARGTSLYDTYEKAGDDAENLSPTGYSLYDGLVLVNKVELL